MIFIFGVISKSQLKTTTKFYGANNVLQNVIVLSNLFIMLNNMSLTRVKIFTLPTVASCVNALI